MHGRRCLQEPAPVEPKPLKAADRPAPAAGKAGGVYIPPFKLAAMMREAKVRKRRDYCDARPLNMGGGPLSLYTKHFNKVFICQVQRPRSISPGAHRDLLEGVQLLPTEVAPSNACMALQDTESAEYQRLTWDALRKSINGLVNKVNVSNIKFILPEFFSEVRFVCALSTLRRGLHFSIRA